VFADKVIVDHRIGQRDQQTVIAVAALYVRFLADAGAPLISTGWCVARLVRAFAFPADWINIRASAKQSAEDGNFFYCLKTEAILQSC